MPPKKAGSKDRRFALRAETSFNLKQLSDHLKLAPATISLVLNGSPVAKTIASDTQKLIRDAAREFNYRPNFFARCLRTKRSFTIGVMVSEVSEGYNATVLSGIEDQLMQEGYFYFVASHGFKLDLIDEYAQLFLHRCIARSMDSSSSTPPGILISRFQSSPFPAITPYPALPASCSIIITPSRAPCST
jgi:DNA-binding LacI/PurR family transcriptional regulator